jgi:hypothetical protein
VYTGLHGTYGWDWSPVLGERARISKYLQRKTIKGTLRLGKGTSPYGASTGVKSKFDLLFFVPEKGFPTDWMNHIRPARSLLWAHVYVETLPSHEWGLVPVGQIPQAGQEWAGPFGYPPNRGYMDHEYLGHYFPFWRRSVPSPYVGSEFNLVDIKIGDYPVQYTNGNEQGQYYWTEDVPLGPIDSRAIFLGVFLGEGRTQLWVNNVTPSTPISTAGRVPDVITFEPSSVHATLSDYTFPLERDGQRAHAQISFYENYEYPVMDYSG